MQGSTDADADTLSLVSVSTPSNSLATVAKSGNNVFVKGSIIQPFMGMFTFNYTITDGTSTSTNTVTVAVYNNAPTVRTISASINATLYPNGFSTSIITNSNTGLRPSDVDVADAPFLRVSAVSGTFPGTATYTDNGVTYSYAPTTSANYTAVITYTVSDGLLTSSGILSIFVYGYIPLTFAPTPTASPTSTALSTTAEPTFDPMLQSGIILQQYDQTTSRYTIIYKTTTRYPAIITDFKLDSITNTTNSTVYMDYMTNTTSYDSNTLLFTKLFTIKFGLTSGCYFTGMYTFTASIGDQNVITVSGSITTENVCTIASIDNALATLFTSYRDASYSTLSSTFTGQEKAYLLGVVTSSTIPIVSITLRDVYVTWINSSDVTLRSGGTNTNIVPNAYFQVSKDNSLEIRFEFVPSALYSFGVGDHSLGIVAVVDIQYSTGRRVTMMTASSTESVKITYKQVIAMANGASAKCFLFLVLLAMMVHL
jgi:hypothetical protein